MSRLANGPGAVDHYAVLLDDGVLPAVLCLAAVRGVPVPDALARYGGFPDAKVCTNRDSRVSFVDHGRLLAGFDLLDPGWV